MSIKVSLNVTDGGKLISRTACSSVKFSTTNFMLLFYILHTVTHKKSVYVLKSKFHDQMTLASIRSSNSSR